MRRKKNITNTPKAPKVMVTRCSKETLVGSTTLNNGRWLFVNEKNSH
uniref:Uncharacterized protein n=1 Tax=Arundo donax TaxID=35708 RepID=A0A0A9CRQ0_ARUDO